MFFHIPQAQYSGPVSEGFLCINWYSIKTLVMFFDLENSKINEHLIESLRLEELVVKNYL